MCTATHVSTTPAGAPRPRGAHTAAPARRAQSHALLHKGHTRELPQASPPSPSKYKKNQSHAYACSTGIRTAGSAGPRPRGCRAPRAPTHAQKVGISDWQSNGPKRLVGICKNTYAVRPPVYPVIYNEKRTTSLTPVNPAFRGRILPSCCMSVRINPRGSGAPRKRSRVPSLPNDEPHVDAGHETGQVEFVKIFGKPQRHLLLIKRFPAGLVHESFEMNPALSRHLTKGIRPYGLCPLSSLPRVTPDLLPQSIARAIRLL
eukprot:COSAG02_NODE_561_length_20308_cov_42.799495_4_plen_260_part_00